RARNPSGRRLCGTMDSGLSPSGCPGMTTMDESAGDVTASGLIRPHADRRLGLRHQRLTEFVLLSAAR
ncbi:hypothetical protein, partial [uncultured Bradyrhizobium sp.]|uniref:hypothetical protein n=1 Tax=uncultured Bradyrhizobium sp. TaxID=199684 RepID=UPI00260BAD1E